MGHVYKVLEESQERKVLLLFHFWLVIFCSHQCEGLHFMGCLLQMVVLFEEWIPFESRTFCYFKISGSLLSVKQPGTPVVNQPFSSVWVAYGAPRKAPWFPGHMALTRIFLLQSYRGWLLSQTDLRWVLSLPLPGWMTLSKSLNPSVPQGHWGATCR